jgi:hypothetical protein
VKEIDELGASLRGFVVQPRFDLHSHLLLALLYHLRRLPMRRGTCQLGKEKSIETLITNVYH